MINELGVSDNPNAVVVFSVKNLLEDRFCQPMFFTGPPVS